ncbi:MAG: c-type cytochrome [Terriglobia bacterium]|jgi:cytochrome c oxidase cbb3-type subunit 3
MKLDTGLSSKCLLIGAGLLVSSLAFQTAVQEADGAAIFKKNCVMCHGADGKGSSALRTPNFTEPKWQSSTKEKEMREVVKNGKRGTAMPAFGDKLKDGEISAVIACVRSLNSSKKK